MTEILIPGDLIEDKELLKNNRFYISENNKHYCTLVSLYNNRLIPLEGYWYPNIDETVVGIIKEVRNNVFEVDLSHFLRAIIINDFRNKLHFNVGDVIEAKVKAIENKKTIILIYPRLLRDGMLIQTKPVKIPRIIGKNNTMINQISSFTKTSIIVGFNGLIYIKGANSSMAISTILRVEKEAHTKGLTENIKQILQKELELTEK
ncbi:MAG: hypothetical protein M1168_00740 [Candidatus Marsarchaeota archaeon]|nr:hypothetical protein [Candidatus Marsarchaeota archaeon]MCL5094497.1 hypothetical protein [Candidatus Marsarchaeota archaeon]